MSSSGPSAPSRRTVTGTLTRTEPQVVEVATVAGHTDQQMLDLAAALEATSTRPLAAAVVASATDAAQAGEMSKAAGHGIAGVIDGVRVRSQRGVAAL